MKFHFIVSASALAMAACPAYAQPSETETPAAANDATASTAGAAEVGDIIVTAQKRAQLLTDVGLSVAVIGAEALKTRNISNSDDLANIVPGLSVGTSGFSTPIYSLRGVGVNELSFSSGSSVAVYVDEVPLTLPVMTRGAVLDLERLEVLKGPQGTLYGQNATGGAINYIAAKPTDDFKAGINASYGRFNSVSVEGFISGPLGETVKGRVAVRADRQFDGWQKSVSRPGDEIGEVKKFTGRAILQWEPMDSLRFTANVNGWIDKSEPQVPQLVQFTGQNGNGTPFSLEEVVYAPSILPPPNQADLRLRTLSNKAGSADWDQFRDFGSDDSFWQASLRADWDVGDQFQLTSITAFMKTKIDSFREQDGIGTSLFPATLGQDVNNSAYTIDSHTKSFTQELRGTLNSGPLVWIVGANYGDETVDDFQVLHADSFPILNRLGGIGFTRAAADTHQDIRSWAVFTNAEYKISDQLSISAGIRYSEEKRDFVGCTRDVDGRAAATFNFLYGLNGAPNQIPVGGCYTINGPRQPGLARLELDENNTPWTVNINYHPTERSLIYARVAKGFKSGNFPTIFTTLNGSYLPVKQESVLSYEGGFKVATTRWFTAEGAVFYYDYRDKQQRGREDVGPPFGLVSKQVNIPKSKLWGGEIAVTVRPVDGLTISVSEVFVKTKILEYSGFNIDGFRGDLSGGPLSFVPKHSLNLDMAYETPVNETLKVFVGGNMAYRSKTTAQLAAASRWDINSYTLFDGQLGIADRANRWRAWIWGKNLTNKFYWNNVIKTAETVNRFTGMPRTFGISASYKFD